jgi:hypothetical protein
MSSDESIFTHPEKMKKLQLEELRLQEEARRKITLAGVKK